MKLTRIENLYNFETNKRGKDFFSAATRKLKGARNYLFLGEEY